MNINVIKYFKKKRINLLNLIFQKIFGINSEFPIPVHFTSQITSPKNIKFSGGNNTIRSFAKSGNCYFSGYNGIVIGYNVLFAPGIKLISSNHNYSNDREPIIGPPIIIGDNVWLGTNVIILPEVNIGKNSIVGAGSVVTRSMPQNSIIGGNPAKIIGWLCECGNKLSKSDNSYKCYKCNRIFNLSNFELIKQ